MDNNGHYNSNSSSSHNNINGGSSVPQNAPTIITEYRREFQWNPPIFGPKVIKPEPMMSSYQAEFGKTIAGGEFYSISQPTSLTNSFNGHDCVDSGLMYNSMMNCSTTTSNAMQATKSVTAPSTPPSVNPRKSTFSPIGFNQMDSGSGQKRPVSASAKSPIATAAATAATSKSTSVLFNRETLVEPITTSSTSSSKTELTTEYHSKFRDFNEYVYLEGQGVFCEASVLKDPELAKKAREWFKEKEERQKQACNYRARSLLGVNSRHPEYTWDGVKVKDRELEALALATRLRLEEKKRSKLRNSNSTSANNNSGVSSIASTRSASARPTKRSSTTYNNHNNNYNTTNDINSIAGNKLNSAPASLQDDRTMSKPSVQRSLIGRSTAAATKGSAAANPVDKNNNTKTQSVKSSSQTNHQSIPASTKSVPIKKKIFIRKQVSQSTNDKTTNGNGDSAAAAGSIREFDPEPKSVPLKTTQIKSPEEIAGIKSPSPESWKVTIEKGGLDWVDGGGGGGTTTGGTGTGTVTGTNLGTGTAEAAGLQQQPVNFVDNSIAKQAYLSTNADQMIRPIPINGAAKINDHTFHETLSSK